MGNENMQITVNFEDYARLPKTTVKRGNAANLYPWRPSADDFPRSQNQNGKWERAAHNPFPRSHPPIVDRGGNVGNEGGIVANTVARDLTKLMALNTKDQRVIIATLERSEIISMLKYEGFTHPQASTAMNEMLLAGDLVALNGDKVQVLA
jgi:hypothetical protein